MTDRPLREAVEDTLVHPASTGEDRQRRLYMALLIFLFVPVGLLFAWNDFRTGDTLVGFAALGLVGALAASLGINRFASRIVVAYRAVAVAVLALLGVILFLGGGGGYAFVWFYFLPPGMFYVFGSREGLFWFLPSFVLAGVLLFWSRGASYPVALGTRFLLTYAILGALSRGLQRSRERLFAQLTQEKGELEQALEEVRTLSEMIPMCAWCRNVRDDAGFWSRIEDYLSRQVGTVVTHGLCPDCAHQLAQDGGAGLPAARTIIQDERDG